MEAHHNTFSLKLFRSILLHATLLSCINLLSFTESATLLGNGTDRLALIAFKNGIFDPKSALSSWRDSLHFCKWDGVICSRQHPQRVTALNLVGQHLAGSLSPHVSNLSFLASVDLSNNNFQGQIPHEIGRLYRLRFLNLSSNSFDGEIPKNLTLCKELKVLELNDNKLDGQIPVELGFLRRLESLTLNHNNFIGSIPPSIGNLTSLTYLDLSINNLEGNIPDDLGRMVNLKVLVVRRNNLSGIVSSSLCNLSTIIFLDVAYNQLHGSLPPQLGLTLPKLEKLIVRRNQFTGSIPISLGNNSMIQHLDFSMNNFTGTVPTNLGRLHDLKWLNLEINNLSGDLGFITALTNCTRLDTLTIGGNKFLGVMPNSIGNLSTQLRQLGMYQNQIYGTIPSGIENLVNLTLLAMQINLLSGTIPSNFQKLQKLQVISLHDNKLSGKIPSSLGNITQLFGLYLQRNVLHGSIPRSLGNCRHLEHLRLSYNNLSGAIPEEVLNIPSLICLEVDMNSLTGSLPFDTNKLRTLTQLNITNNKFSGNIPSSLGSCTHLEYLYMKGNFFEGSIPSSLSSLKSIQVLDLSHNNLSGQIPKYLEQLPFLQLLNLSSNSLEGEVPTLGIFRNTSAISLSGNRKLCGGISELQLPACPRLPTKKQGRDIVIGVAAVGLFLLLSSFLAIRFLLTKSTKKPTSASFMRNSFLGVTYAMLFKATDGFSSANLIGAGSHGSVYKGLLDCIETPVAIKILKLQQKRASESFIAECKALGRIQHRNIIKILTVCSSIDFRGNDFKALVFQYMANGSLDMWLHPKGNEKLKSLNLLQRLNVAIDVAYALDYLHHHCEAPVIHCDLKPGNVLLDDDMVAHLGDFGLARILSNDVISSSRTQSNMLEMKGSIGYIAPEYGMGGDVSTCGDVYSYGILLLEMLTGKRPTDDIFKENQNLHQFAKMVLLEQVMEIIDHQLLLEEITSIRHNENYCDMRCRMHETLVSLVRIGVSCSIESPKERMKMNDVLIELLRVKEFYLGVGKY